MKNKKTLFLIVSLLAYMTTAWSQSLSIATKPTDLPDELCSMALMGSSANGRYLYGALKGKGFALDTQTNQYVICGDNATACEMVGVSSNGWYLLAAAESGESSGGLVNLVKLVPLDSTNGERSIPVTSPDPEHPYFSLWYMTSDAKYFCGNILNSSWKSIPIVGELNAEGTEYKITKLPIPNKDPLGTKPQQYRILFVSEDGATLVGFLIEESGNLATIITYSKQADGTYEIHYPADDILFDHSVTVPPYPEYSDYVTVPQDPEDPNYNADKLQEQEAAYDKARDEYYKMFDLFTRNMTLKQYSLSVGSKGMYALATVVEAGVDEEGFRITKGVKYISVNLKTKEALLIDYPAGTSEETSPRDLIGSRQELLCAVPVNGRYWNAFVYTHDKKMISLVEWVKRETQQDFTSFYTMPDPISNEPTLYTGWPEVSKDGKTITLLGYPNNESKIYRNSYFRFGESILAISPNYAYPEQDIWFDGRLIHASEPASFYIFNVEGQLLYQSSPVAQIDIASTQLGLSHGDYIALAVTPKGVASSIKVSL